MEQRKNERIRQMTTYLRSINSDFKFCSAVICVLLLPEGLLLEQMIILEFVCNNLQLTNNLFNNLIAYLVLRTPCKLITDDLKTKI